MQIERTKLLKDLATCMPALSLGNTNPNNYFSVIYRNGKTFICTTNEEAAVMLPIDYELPIMRVRGSELFLSLKSITSDKVNLELADTLIISTEDSVTCVEISLEETTLFDTIPEVNDWKNLPTDFMEKLVTASRCTAKDSSISVKFMYVYAAEDRMIGSDGMQFIYSTLENDVDKMFIKYAVVKPLSNYKPLFYSVGNDWLQFKNSNGIIFAVHTLSSDERYPIVITLSDWSEQELQLRKDMIIDNLIKVNGSELILTDVKKIVSIVESCKIFTKSAIDREEILITVQNGNMIISGIGNHGSHKRKIKIDTDANLRFRIDPNLLINALNSGNKFIISQDVIGIIGDKFAHIVQLIGN